MIIMSVDLGKARTGIAVSDNSETFAFPKTVIKEYNTEKLINKLISFSKELKAELVVFGIPKNMDGSEGFRANECTEIADKFREASRLETVMWDERCTTVSAYTALNYSGTFGKKRKEVVDAVAATIILEDYLAFRKNQK